mgnify:CR=1 FL=1
MVGRDPHQIEDTWQFLYRGAYWRKGPVTMTTISAVDMALWDIKAKAANMPLYQLLGGKSRTGVMVYGHANGDSIEETVEEVGKFLEAGYHAVRAQTGIPGLKSTYGVSKDKMFYEPADSELPTENEWSTTKYLDNIPKLFETLRSAYGNEPHLLHDVHHRLTPIEAASLGKDLESFRLFWLEDAVPAENQAGFRLIRQNTVTPLAVGEIFNTIWDCKQLIEEQLIDYIRTTVVHAGGLTHLRRIADFASLYHVRTGCHGATDLSPICMGSALHFDLWVPNFGIEEYMRHSEETNAVFPLAAADAHVDAAAVVLAVLAERDDDGHQRLHVEVGGDRAPLPPRRSSDLRTPWVGRQSSHCGWSGVQRSGCWQRESDISAVRQGGSQGSAG